MKKLFQTVLLLHLVSIPAFASNDADAIEHLLVSVGSSGCTFIRNGKEYSSADAEDHLRMYLQLGGDQLRGERLLQNVEYWRHQEGREGPPRHLRASSRADEEESGEPERSPDQTPRLPLPVRLCSG